MNFSINFSGYLSQFFRIRNITYYYENLKLNLNITYDFESNDLKIQKLTISIINIKIYQLFNTSSIREIQQKSNNLNGWIIVELIDDLILTENILHLRIDVFINNFLNSNQSIEIDFSAMDPQKNTNITLNALGAPYITSILFVILCIFSFRKIKKNKRHISMKLMDLEFN
jgi:hypothetical protein